MYARVIFNKLEKDVERVETLREHAEKVAEIASHQGSKMGLSDTLYLIGILHDMGKATEEFQKYLFSNGSIPKCHPHSFTGAIYAYDTWYRGQDFYNKLTAQLISMVIIGHHAGMPDLLNEKGKTPFLDSLKEKRVEAYYAEAVSRFLEIYPEIELKNMFEKSVKEIKTFCEMKIFPATREDVLGYAGLLARLLESYLVDADRWDAACFETGEDPLKMENPLSHWKELQETFDSFREKLDDKEKINKIRAEVSETCVKKADLLSENIFSLSVPTGGGKTYSSLRFALERAKIKRSSRIIYVIPFNTILDQNAKDIREALDHYEGILEHHSNVVLPDEDQDENKNSIKRYQVMTERWNSEIILTSMVHFLEAAYRKENGKCRRFHRMTNAVIIFDEIQALPKKTKGLFERLISFLAECCGTTVVLCTATQPELHVNPKPIDIIPVERGLEKILSRVRYSWEKEKKTAMEAAEKISDQVIKGQSVLCIVNKKTTAEELYRLVKSELEICGKSIVEGARQGKASVRLIHLSTNMCPKHRLDCIDQIKKDVSFAKKEFERDSCVQEAGQIDDTEGMPVVCISTALIEAGVNVSFPVVIRSLAGLPSIVQAAGRCNRNMEAGKGDVFIWTIEGDDSSSSKALCDIYNGAIVSGELLEANRNNLSAIETRKVLDEYFHKEAENYTNRVRNYPIDENDRKKDADKRNLVELLGNNEYFFWLAENRDSFDGQAMVLYQSFKTAGSLFHVIEEQNTHTLLVPYGEEGKRIIEELSSDQSPEERRRSLKKAQLYSVEVYDDILKKIKGAVSSIGQTGVQCLPAHYYSDIFGVTGEKTSLMEFIDIG